MTPSGTTGRLAGDDAPAQAAGPVAARRPYPSRPCDSPPVLRHAARRSRPRPRCRRIGCCCAPATCASSGRASTRCCPSASGSATGSSRSSARRSTRSAGRRWRCRSSTRPRSGRRAGATTKIGPELVRFKDRGERDMVLAMTHEEVVAILLRDIVQSYRQLPMIVYHFQTKFRDEPRARGGLIRVREFVMKDSYSCDRDDAGLDASYRAQHGRLRADLRAARARRDRGRLRRRDHGRHRRPRVHGPQPDFGEDTLVLCDSCGYAANQQIAIVGKPDPGARGPAADRGGRDARRDDDRRARASWTSPKSKTAKAAFFVTGDGRFVVAIVRGDYDVNETKLVNAVKARRRPPAGDRRGDQGARAWSPATARRSAPATRSSSSTTSSPRSPNLVAGANRVGCHVRNVNVAARLHAGPRRRHHERPRGRPLPDLRLAGASSATASRSATSSSSAPSSPTRSGRRTWARTASATRSSWARTGSGSGATSPASSRRTTTTRASSGRPRSRRTRRTSCRSAARRSRACSRSPSGSTTSPPRPARATRSCGTTATSRPGSSSPTPSCSACPGS